MKKARPLQNSRDLKDASPEGLENIYARSVVPDPAELEGRLRGEALYLFPGLLGGLSFFGLLEKFFSLWKGAVFTVGAGGRVRGVNLFFKENAPTLLMAFEARRRESAFGPGETILLDYNIQENSRIFRPVRDEIRRAADGLYLGRSFMIVGGWPRSLAWFVLERT